MPTAQQLFCVWCVLMSLFAFLLFGYDKLRAGRSGTRRVSEFQLVLIAALGGWVGGLLGMLVFHHKTAKVSFQLKYAAALLIWAGLLYCALNS